MVLANGRDVGHKFQSRVPIWAGMANPHLCTDRKGGPPVPQTNKDIVRQELAAAAR